MKILKKIWQWFKESNRFQHLGLGFICGTLSEDWYCTLYVGVGVAGALEFKDYQWGGKPDVIDFFLTVAGFCAGYLVKSLIFKH